MERINKLKNSNLNQEEVDETLEALINEKFDTAKKARYKRILARKYGIDRSDLSQSIKPKSSKIFRIPNLMKVAASLLLLISAAYFVGLKVSDNQKLLSAAEYIQNEDLKYMDVVRGKKEESELRAKAIETFQSKSYLASMEIFQQIPNESKNATDFFYQSYCQLKLGMNEEAIEGFAKSKHLLNDGDPLYQESVFYLIIALIQNGEIERAKIAADSLENDSWEAQELEKINFK